jgi:TolB-like protein/DNA-binding winged helix-turn-helix (wHTH) protein/Tfp pilus assembly protein PilF
MAVPAMDAPRETIQYEFGGLRLEPQRRALRRRDGSAVELAGKPFDVLVYLVERAGALVTRDELTKALWPHTIVEDANLSVAVSALRRTLDAEAPGQRFVATIAGRGYQFVAPVERRAAESVLPAVRGAGETSSVPEVAAATEPHAGRLPWFVAIAAVAVLVTIVAAIGLWGGSGSRPEPPAGTVTLAVLPFKSLTPADRNESLELGMTETLIAGLQSKELHVSPLSSVRRFAAPDQDAVAAGRALDVRAVLEGYVQRNGDKLRVSVRLLDVADGRTLWTARFDESFQDIFSVQDAVASRVRASLTPEVVAGRASGLRRYTSDAEAYQLYVDGRFHRTQPRTATSLRQALAKFEQAIARDPQFALAYVGVSEVRAMFGVFGILAPHDTFPQARTAAETAVRLAPDLGEAYTALGHVKSQYDHDWRGAEVDFQRALRLSPGYATAWQWYGILHGYAGRFDEAVRHLRKAQELDPGAVTYRALVGMLLSYERRHDEAITSLEETLEMDPLLPTANTYLTAAYLRSGRYAEAMTQLERVHSAAPGSAGYRGQIYALTGRRAEAVAEVHRLEALSRERYVSAYDIATIHAALGDADRAFEWLERAFSERSGLVAWLPWEPVFDGLRGDARYTRLVARLPAGGHRDRDPASGTNRAPRSPLG